MRISDWSSDVCSSDLQAAEHARRGQADVARILRCAERLPLGVFDGVEDLGQVARTGQFGEVVEAHQLRRGRRQERRVRRRGHVRDRSEEHTSELQSLMSISYAVFCLKKKTKKSP